MSPSTATLSSSTRATETMNTNDVIVALSRLDGYRLLLVNGKVPTDPATGRPCAWDAFTLTPHQLSGYITAGIGTGVGMHTGPGAAPGGGDLVAFDLDGAAGVAWCKDRGCDPAAADTWQVGRDTDPNRLKVLWRVPALGGTYKRLLRLKDKTATSKGEGIEVFAGVGQIVVWGAHPASGGCYTWRGSPDQLGDITPAWAALLDGINAQGPAAVATRTRNTTGRGEWRRLSPCPICGRDNQLICQRHRDGRTIRCFQGETFHPPSGLRPGDVLPGGWAFCREQESPGVGTFSIFTEHRPLEQRHAPRGGRRGYRGASRRAAGVAR